MNKLSVPILKKLCQNKFCGQSISYTSRVLGLSLSTVSKYFDRIEAEGLTLEGFKGLEDEALSEILQPSKRAMGGFVEPDWEGVFHDHKGRKIPLRSLWEQYSRDAQGTALSYPAFCRNYKIYEGNLPVRLEQVSASFEWKPGEVLQIDYSGDPLYLSQPDGTRKKVQIFVAVLPYSSYTVAIATLRQTRDDWLDALVDTFNRIGGAPEYVMLDNSTSLVTRADRYNPKVCPEFQAFCEYYGTEPLPVTPGKPKHKAAVENTVRLVQERCTRPLENRTFFDLETLNKALSELCDKHNEAMFSERWKLTRKARFEEERPHLKPLPPTAFEKSSEIKILTVRKDSLVRYKDRRYSVPYGYVGQKVRVIAQPRAMKLTVYDVMSGRRIAEHQIRTDQRPSIRLEHLPRNIQVVHMSNGDRRNQIAKAGPNAEAVADALLKQPSRRAVKWLSGLLSHLNRLGPQALESACQWALEHDRATYDGVMEGFDALDLDRVKQTQRPLGANTTVTVPAPGKNYRGPDYYRRKED